MKRAGMILLLLLLPMMLLQAQDVPLPPLPLAVEYQGKLYVMTAIPRSIDELPGVLTLISDEISPYQPASWSPDGTKLSFGGNKIWDGVKTIELDIASYMPTSWTHDGRILSEVLTPVEGIDYKASFYVVAPEAGAQPEPIVENLSVQEGCGIGTLVPMQAHLWNEIGIADIRPILTLTDYGLVYPAGCNGSTISLYRPNSGENVAFANGNLNQAALSLDGSRLAGIVYDADSMAEKIVIVDLMTLAETTLTTTESPSVVTWGGDGSLYYAAESRTRNLLDGFTPEQVAQVTTLVQQPSDSDFYDANTVRIYRRAPDGMETLLHEQDAFAVGKFMFRSNRLIYSTIANGDGWVQGLADGTLTGDNVYFGAAYDTITTLVHLMRLNADGTVAETITLPGDLRRVAG